MAVKGEVLFYDNGGSEMEGPRENKSSTIFSFSQKCLMPMEKGTAHPSGSRTYEQFEVVKSIDKITPLLWKALCEGEDLQKVEVTLYEIAEATGSETPYFKFTLTNARIASLTDYMPSSFDESGDETGHLEKVNIAAQEYEWEHLTGSTMHHDQPFFGARK